MQAELTWGFLLREGKGERREIRKLRSASWKERESGREGKRERSAEKRQRVEKRERWVGERKRKKRREPAEFHLLKGQGGAAHVQRNHTAGQGSALCVCRGEACCQVSKGQGQGCLDANNVHAYDTFIRRFK